MVRIKSTPRRSRRLWGKYKKRQKFIIKERLETPKSISFRGKIFTVRYKRVSKKRLKKANNRVTFNPNVQIKTF